MASEVNSMLHVRYCTYGGVEQGDGGIMKITQQTFAYVPQTRPSRLTYRRTAAGHVNPPSRSRRRRKVWLSPASV
jgi:hypothetical protein